MKYLMILFIAFVFAGCGDKDVEIPDDTSIVINSSLEEELVTYNDLVAEERPRGGYFLHRDDIKESIQSQMHTIPKEWRAAFRHIEEGRMPSIAKLFFMGKPSGEYFFVRLEVMKGKSGYALEIGQDKEFN